MPELTELPADSLVRLVLPPQPPRQSRLSFLLRAPLAVPFAIALLIFAAVTQIAVLFAWFAALATGKVPQALRKFILSFVNFDTRFEAFLFFLVRRPPLRRTSTTNVPITVSANEVPLSRIAVLFRPVLVLPAMIVLSVFGTGMVVIWAVMLIWGLLTKSIPTPLSELTALFVRFRARTLAYQMLLSPNQPFAGLYGDTGAEEENASNEGSS